MKHQMILAVEQKDFAFRRRQVFTKGFCELYGRKSASNDNNSYGLHSLAPVARLIDFPLPLRAAVDFNAALKKHFRCTSKHRNETIPRISKTCEFYWNVLVLNSQAMACTPR